MSKKMFIAALISAVLLCLPAQAQRNQGYTFHQVQVVDDIDRKVTDINEVYIYLPDTTTNQTIYKDRALTQAITLPMTTASTNTTLSNGFFSWWGQDTYDFKIGNDTTTASNPSTSSFDSSVGRITFPYYLQTISTASYTDAQSITLGTDSDWVIQGGASANLLTMTPVANNSVMRLGADAATSDVHLFGAATDIYWDASENTLEVLDNTVIAVGTGDDYTISHNGSTTTVAGAYTTSGAVTHSTDVTFDGTNDVMWDDSEFTFHFADSAVIGFGNTGATPDIEARWDATDLDVLAAADGTIIKFGNATNDFDIWWYASDAGDYALFDEGNAQIALLDVDLDLNDDADIIIGTSDDVVLDYDGTGNDVEFTEGDGHMILSLIGFEANESRLTLLADQDDDATDGWEFAALTTGSLTIGNDSAVAGTFVDKLTIAGSTGNVTLTGDIVNENADTLVMSNDDVLQFTSNDGAATIQVLGFEASNAVLSLDADEADDNADTWTHTVADGGAYTIANEGTATLTINEVVAFGSGNTNAVVAPGDGTPYTVTAANSGKVHVITDQTGDMTINMPAEAAGLYYKFIYIGAAADVQDWIIDTGSDTNYFIGGIVQHDPDAGGDDTAVYYSDNDSNSKIGVLTPEAGTVVEVWCNGTQWYVNGSVISATDTGVTFGDQ